MHLCSAHMCAFRMESLAFNVYGIGVQLSAGLRLAYEFSIISVEHERIFRFVNSFSVSFMCFSYYFKRASCQFSESLSFSCSAIPFALHRILFCILSMH